MGGGEPRAGVSRGARRDDEHDGSGGVLRAIPRLHQVPGFIRRNEPRGWATAVGGAQIPRQVQRGARA